MRSSQTSGLIGGRRRDGIDAALTGRGVIYFARLGERRTQSKMSSIVGTPEYQSMKIRSWSTTTKLLDMLDRTERGEARQTGLERGGGMAQRTRWPVAVAREARAGPEFAAFMAFAGPLLARAPRGDGHPILVLPGLGASDLSTRPLRWFLDRLGYRSHGWGIGRNTGLSRRTSAVLADQLDALVGEQGRRVSLVGWSLGGVYATGLAEHASHRVRSVITLGSPLVVRPQARVGVPMTSVYSRSDAIVPWRASILPRGTSRESVEVRGSHLGLGHNPAVLVVVADRLSQPEGAWQPFVAPSWARRWIPRLES